MGITDSECRTRKDEFTIKLENYMNLLKQLDDNTLNANFIHRKSFDM